MSCLSTRASIRASSVSGGGSCAFPGQLRAHSHRVRAVGAEGGTGGASNYNDQITAYAQGGQWQAAQTVHEEMRAKGMQPDIVAYDALITACDNTAQWRLAEAAFEEMQANGLTPDKVTYSQQCSSHRVRRGRAVAGGRDGVRGDAAARLRRRRRALAPSTPSP